MTVSRKFKPIDSKMEQNQAQYNLDRQATNISALSLGNDAKYDLLRCLTRKRPVRKKKKRHCKEMISVYLHIVYIVYIVYTYIMNLFQYITEI